MSETTSKMIDRHKSFSDLETEEEFHRRGFVVRPLLNEDQIELLTKLYYQFNPQTPADYLPSAFDSDLEKRLQIHEKVTAVLEPELEKLLPSYRACLGSFVAKCPGRKEGKVPLHQDYSFADPPHHLAIHIWCPLIDVDEDNGCLKAIVGSHAVMNHVSAIAGNPAPYDKHRALLEEEFMTTVPMGKGNSFLFDGRLLHCSEPNMSKALRISVGCVMLPREFVARLYSWDRAKPNIINELAVADEFLTTFDPFCAPSEPYPDGVSFVRSIEKTVMPLSLEEIQPLRPASLTVSITQSEKPVVPIFSDVALDHEFRHKGYVIASLLSDSEVRELYSRFMAANLELSEDFFATATNTDRDYRKRVADDISEILEPAIQKLLVNYRCCQANYVVKKAGGANGKVPVHQDYTFTNPELHTAVHVWTPLVDVDEINGCLKVMPGSHTFFNHIAAIGSNPHPYDSFLSVIDSEFMTAHCLKAGQALIYDGRLLHASEKNNSQELRIATNCVMLPVGVNPRLHKWHSETPQMLTRIEMSDEVFLNFDIGIGIAEPYPASVKVLKPLRYESTSVSLELIKSHMDQYLPSNRVGRIFDTVFRIIRKFL